MLFSVKDGKDYDLVLSISGHLYTFTNGTMLIDSVTKRDEGIYRCTAENGIGAILYKNVVIDVNGKCMLLPNDYICIP